MASPLTVVIFGASGDLTSRKLVPALYSLFRKKRLAAGAKIVGVARSPLSDDEFRQRLGEAARKFAGKQFDQDLWASFARQVHYVPGDAAAPGGLDALKQWLAQAEGSGDGGNRLYYLAVAPELMPEIVQRLSEEQMNRDAGGWRRLVIEKPFGRDLGTAKELNRVLHQHFEERQIYRIDHYLGKETVQNILVFRFANTLFEPVWNHQYIDHVQINVAEDVVIGSRAGYYDTSGVLRDMLQSHLLQLMTLVAMEAPARFAADPLRNEKIKVLDAIPIPTPEEAVGQVVTGQYAGYLQEKGVKPGSRTPTYAAIRLSVDNWRWRGVPFYLRSGKGLSSRLSEVIIQFHCPPHMMFSLPKDAVLQCNRLSLTIQPNEGIQLNFQTKVPDQQGVILKPANLEFQYDKAYAHTPIPEAYEILLQDALNGDAALFMRSDEIERAWEIMDPLIAATERADAPTPQEYPVGSHGPKASDDFLAADGRKWISMREEK